MNESLTPHNEVALRILSATNELMAKEGIHQISTHKIAKQAKVSVGTLYLYFKDKEDLLNQLVLYLFELYQQHLQQHYDDSRPLFEQYQALWRSSLDFMQKNPNISANVHQYESLPSYRKLAQGFINRADVIWCEFVKNGKAQGKIIDLEPHILYALSMGVVWNIMRQQMILQQTYSDDVIDQLISRTWKAITL